MRATHKVIAVAAALTLVVTGCGTRPATTAENKGGELALANPFTDAFGLVEAAKQGTRKAKSSKTTVDAVTKDAKVTGTLLAYYDGPASKIEANMTIAGEAGVLRLVDQTLYLKLPPSEQAELKTDKAWGKLDLNSTDPQAKAMGKALLRSFEMGDPAKQLELVEKTGRIVRSEQTQLNGVPVNHYFVEYDVKKQIELFLGEDVPAEQRAEVEKRLGDKDLRVPAELWFNAEQLPLKMTMDLTSFMKSAGAPDPGEVRSTYTYSDWGTPVNVTAPPAAEVSDYTELLKKAGN
ncbi:hypothetical protein [Amycolatopsis keratiniphila]|uniref:Lipoprotein n=1 Tax=Amycolatopsis keratiniphila subsp. keratiniphila TaxID=227715 RepID=A0A1W2LKK7_9PSEU|nr:hypothetical protein [Amycolatopsis keratiniphila]OLZ54940.1 hypothetical protein BS330_20595 [Amycolatopsis keratiniphila subsp. nogabecina]ONF63168.1 hypothetical protein AVR91_0233945 [Amycolatopsis keratiniphila subsp. keratiniphila]SDU64892.1 hypothetical protein SAMN04489733_7659 [Amycolatopsis keratiniphila]